MYKAPEEIITAPGWLVYHSGGTIQRLCACFGETLCNIPMRADAYAGICWLIDGKEVPLSATKQNGRLAYVGHVHEEGLELTLSLFYTVNNKGQLVVTAAAQNEQSACTRPFCASLRLGFDTFLEQYPAYNNQLFPTLLRCEKTHLWGYFSSPSGRLLALFSDAPVASYTMNYEKNAQGIFTVSLDLLQPGKLPQRHPQHLEQLSADEKKVWNIAFMPIKQLYDIWSVKPVIAENSRLPVFHANRYTIAPGEESQITVFSKVPICKNALLLTMPNGKTKRLPLTPSAPHVYHAVFKPAVADIGIYTATLRNQAGYQAEMCLSVRRPWSWYVQMARNAAAETPQKASSHAESWYGFYSAYLARRYFPKATLDRELDRHFNEIFSLLYQNGTTIPLIQKDRIQNHSSMLGVFVNRYECTGASADLEQAERLAELVLSFQREDGGFYKGNTDYTSVIYPAKSIMELVHAEKSRANNKSVPPNERQRCAACVDRHMEALGRAMEHLAVLEGNFQTEGATASCYEDGANSCSATQLSEFALLFPKGSPERSRYTEAARHVLEKHTSHEQALIPDSRMVGGTLRWWEAQYDVEMGGTNMAPRAQMMVSPHGWSAWNIYGLFHLYELTGEISYLQRGMNAIGSCAQLMGFDGTLRWAFVQDPYRQTRLFVKDEEASHGDHVVGKHIERTIGEEYIPMISGWWTSPPHTLVCGYTAMGGPVTQGAACDNDVHEVFKALGELVLTKAYVFENNIGSFECYNASAVLEHDVLIIVPAEEIVSCVSVQLKQPRTVTIQFNNETKTKKIPIGNPHWICAAKSMVNPE
ncbi:MAG: hypothetical protein RR576_09670 [Oscillospiraceae bacterium]